MTRSHKSAADDYNRTGSSLYVLGMLLYAFRISGFYRYMQDIHTHTRVCVCVTYYMDFPGNSACTNPPAMQDTPVGSLCREDPLEKGQVTHSSSVCVFVCLCVYVTYYMDFPGNSAGKNPPAMQETPVGSLCREDPLEKGQVTHSSILGLPWWLRW